MAGKTKPPSADKTAKEQRGDPFKAGQSGNPSGRPPGSRNKATLALETLLDGEAEALTRKAIELAKAGDLTALRLCLDRILPPRKDRPVAFALPPIASSKDALQALSALLTAVSTGELTPSEAAEVGKLVDGYVKATEINELAERLERLEKMMDDAMSIEAYSPALKSSKAGTGPMIRFCCSGSRPAKMSRAPFWPPTNPDCSAPAISSCMPNGLATIRYRSHDGSSGVASDFPNRKTVASTPCSKSALRWWMNWSRWTSRLRLRALPDRCRVT